jgi:hypothetical protein
MSSTTNSAVDRSSRRATALRWFRCLVWAGIVANIAVALVAIIDPTMVLDLLRLEPAQPLVWPRFASYLLILLSVFYVPAALDPSGQRFAAVWAVACRFAGVVFFVLVGGNYIAFGLFDLAFGLPQAIALYCARMPPPPGSEAVLAGRVRRVGLIMLVVAVALAGVGWAAYAFLTRPIVPVFASDEEHFKYGSIGNDGATGIPYPIWLALPKVCSKYLPGPDGYAAFGFLWEPGRNPATDPPVGFSKARVGVDRMSINCAFCHTARTRLAADAEPRLHVAAAGNMVDLQGYLRFLGRCANDVELFSAKALIPQMQATPGLSWIERLVYTAVLIPATRKGLLKQDKAFAWTQRRPNWGVGRIEPFNPVKFGMLGLKDDDTVGVSDMQPIWNINARLQIRPNAPFHWDGLNTSIHEVIVSSALGDGATADAFDFKSMDRIERFLRAVPAPPSPHKPEPAAVDRGSRIFTAQCAECHGAEGSRTLTVIPIGEVDTDGHRALMWTDAARDAYNSYRKGYDWGFKSFRNIEGYIAEPLQGLWLTGPYLHNGSIPTLRDLLTPPADRPASFVRGVDIIDQRNGGFISPPCNPRTPPDHGFCFDTAQIGNGNGGHAYGTSLPPEQKADLLAYLLTL